MAGDTNPHTKAEFRDALDALLLTAYAIGAAIDGETVSLRHDNPNVPDWEMRIEETEADSDRER